MNYSNTDFNLISNENEKLIQSFNDKRINFPKQKVELGKEYRSFAESKNSRIVGMNPQ